nr:alpha/beta fold hydrolase [Schlegelella koreensis]
MLRAWIVEVITAPLVFCWRQPFRSQAIPDAVDSKDAQGRPVLLVHGFLCNRGFWNPWMRRLRARGIAFGAPSLEPAFGSIDAYADTIERAARQLHAASDQPIVIVAHSMGGLAVRAWLRRYPQSEGLVWRIVTIASPHQGTAFARHAPSTNGQQMQIGSRWLSSLAGTESLERRAKFTCYFGNCDNIVFPATRALLPGAVHHHLPSTAHVRMASRREIFDEVLRATELR